MDINIDSSQKLITELNNKKSIVWNSVWISKYNCHIGLFFILKIIIYCIYFKNDIYIEYNAVGIISPNSTDTIDQFDDFMDIIRKPTPPRLPPSPVQKGIAQNILSYFKLV